MTDQQTTKINIEKRPDGWSMKIEWANGDKTFTGHPSLHDLLTWTKNTVREDGTNAR